MNRKEHDMAIVIAHPVNPATPTVGPFLLDCSECGPLGILPTTVAADLAVMRHAGAHVGVEA